MSICVVLCDFIDLHAGGHVVLAGEVHHGESKRELVDARLGVQLDVHFHDLVNDLDGLVVLLALDGERQGSLEGLHAKGLAALGLIQIDGSKVNLNRLDGVERRQKPCRSVSMVFRVKMGRTERRARGCQRRCPPDRSRGRCGSRAGKARRPLRTSSAPWPSAPRSRGQWPRQRD